MAKQDNMSPPQCYTASVDPVTTADMATQSAPETAQLPPLLMLPAETLKQIFEYACAHPTSIKPELWLPGSSKFGHDSMYTKYSWGECHRDPARINGRLPEALTAVELLLTCRSTYRIVDGENLFYELNSFEFRDPMCMLNYLKVLPSRRRNALKDISVLWTPYNPTHAFTALKACQNLRRMTVDIALLNGSFRVPPANDIERALGFKELITLRGLQSLNLTYGEIGNSWNLVRFMASLNEGNVRLEITELESSMNELVTLERTPALLLSASELAEALSYSNIMDRDILVENHPRQTTNNLETLETKPYESSNDAVIPQPGLEWPWNDPQDVWDIHVPLRRRLLLSTRRALSSIKGRTMNLYSFVRNTRRS